MSEAVYDKTKEFERVTVRLAGRKQIMPQLGMPRKLTVQYIFFENYMQLRLEWTDKDVSRLPEEIWLHLGISPDRDKIFYHKLGQKLSPYAIVPNGGRNLSVTEGIEFDAGGKTFRLQPKQAVPVSLGRGKLLRFDNKLENSKYGISFLVQNNIWGTNYPLWYEDNASVWFDIAPVEEYEKGIKSYEPKIQVNVVKLKALDDKKYILTDEERAEFNKAMRNAVNKKPAPPAADSSLVAADVIDDISESETASEPKTVKANSTKKTSEKKEAAKPAYSGLGIVKPIMDRATVLNDDLIEPTDDDDDPPAPVSSIRTGRMVTLGENSSADRGRLSIQSRAGARINLGDEPIEEPTDEKDGEVKSAKKKSASAASAKRAKSAAKPSTAKSNTAKSVAKTDNKSTAKQSKTTKK